MNRWKEQSKKLKKLNNKKYFMQYRLKRNLKNKR